MAILVTGAAGFVGLNTLEHLLAAGRPVVALDRIALPAAAQDRFATLPGTLKALRGSIENPADLAAALTTAPIDAVIHCAVITAAAAREVADPESIVAVNVMAAAATLTAAARHGVRRFVYPSSGAVYGHAARGADLLDEDRLMPKPANLYGATKFAAEIVLDSIARSQKIAFVAARLGTVFGPWEYATGVRDTLSPMLQTIDLLKRGEVAVLPPAHTVDYIYSRDVAAGLAILADAVALPRTVYNLGTGRTFTAADWCRQLAELTPGFRWHHAAPGEPANVVTHTAFDRPAMNVMNLTRDTGFQAHFMLADAARDYLLA